MEKLKTYHITFDPDNFESGIDFIALTENPAIEEFALRFCKIEQEMQIQFNSDKRLIVGPAMIPDKKIYRKEGDHEFYVVFTQEVIDQMLEKFKSEHRALQFNIEHDENQKITGFVKEAWIIEDSVKDKSAFYGFNLPVGTLMISAKIQDVDSWQSIIKNMDQVGFSVEGLMGIQKFTLQNKKEEMKKNKKNFSTIKFSLKRAFNKSTKKFEEVTTEEDVTIVAEDLEVGTEVEQLDTEGNVEAIADGDYVIETESVSVSVEDGTITEVSEIIADDSVTQEEAEVEEEVEMTEVEKEVEKEVEEEVEEDKKFELDPEILAKLIELESRLEALEAAITQVKEEDTEIFNKNVSRFEKMELLRSVTKR